MAASSPKKSSETPAPGKEAKSKDPIFTLIDLSQGSVQRRIRVPKDYYAEIQILQTRLEPTLGRLSLEELLVYLVEVGTVAVLNDYNAPRELPRRS